MTTTTVNEPAQSWTRKSFASDQDVRWCPGCGDYVILSSVHKALSNIGRAPHEHVFVSGIGCSSRFPYYMNTYGFHGIHGRAPAIASGVKVTRPELCVWVITGDGDGLSIGGNHLLHLMRRNIDVNILLFNNRIYGLTKGQYSPCSEHGKRTKTSPMGSIEQPINALSFAIASQATFVARTYDSDPKHMTAIFEQAARHRGTSFVEVFQNCKIFNDGAFENVTNREVRSDQVVFLQRGKPLIFGNLRNKGVRLNGVDPEIVEFDPESPPDDLLVHDDHGSVGLAYLLTRLNYPDFPAPMGVFREVEAPIYETQLHAQIAQAREKSGKTSIHSLLRRNAETWIIEPPAGAGEPVQGSLMSVGHELAEHREEKDSYLADLEQDEIESQGLERVLHEKTLAAVPAQTATVVVTPETPVAEALNGMRAGQQLGTIAVCSSSGRIEGIVTERDVLLRLPLDADLETTPVSEIMTANPELLDPSDTIAHALNFMGVRNYRRLLIDMEDDVIVLSVDDVFDFILDSDG